MLAADMLSFENEPTAVLHELRASGMALPLLEEAHVMQLRTPDNAKLRSPGDLTSLTSPTERSAQTQTVSRTGVPRLAQHETAHATVIIHFAT